MARIHTHYDNLKVARNAPPEVIRAAYKTLSQKYHPDRNPNKPDAMRIIKIINSAYEVLSDPVKRKEHDDWIAGEEAKAEKAAPPPNSGYTADNRHGMGSAAPRPPPSRRYRTHKKSGSFIPQAFRQQAWMLLNRLSKYISRKV